MHHFKDAFHPPVCCHIAGTFFWCKSRIEWPLTFISFALLSQRKTNGWTDGRCNGQLASQIANAWLSTKRDQEGLNMLCSNGMIETQVMLHSGLASKWPLHRSSSFTLLVHTSGLVDHCTDKRPWINLWSGYNITVAILPINGQMAGPLVISVTMPRHPIHRSLVIQCAHLPPELPTSVLNTFR